MKANTFSPELLNSTFYSYQQKYSSPNYKGQADSMLYYQHSAQNTPCNITRICFFARAHNVHFCNPVYARAARNGAVV